MGIAGAHQQSSIVYACLVNHISAYLEIMVNGFLAGKCKQHKISASSCFASLTGRRLVLRLWCAKPSAVHIAWTAQRKKSVLLSPPALVPARIPLFTWGGEKIWRGRETPQGFYRGAAGGRASCWWLALRVMLRSGAMLLMCIVRGACNVDSSLLILATPPVLHARMGLPEPVNDQGEWLSPKKKKDFCGVVQQQKTFLWAIEQSRNPTAPPPRLQDDRHAAAAADPPLEPGYARQRQRGGGGRPARLRQDGPGRRPSVAQASPLWVICRRSTPPPSPRTTSPCPIRSSPLSAICRRSTRPLSHRNNVAVSNTIVAAVGNLQAINASTVSSNNVAVSNTIVAATAASDAGEQQVRRASATVVHSHHHAQTRLCLRHQVPQQRRLHPHQDRQHRPPRRRRPRRGCPDPGPGCAS